MMETVGKGTSDFFSVLVTTQLALCFLLRTHHFITNSSISCPMELTQMNLQEKKKKASFILSVKYTHILYTVVQYILHWIMEYTECTT